LISFKMNNIDGVLTLFKKKEKGFSIIETLVVIFVFTLFWGAMMASVYIIYRTQSFTMQQSIAINEARRGVEIMAKEIRQARYGDNGAYPIEKGGGKEFIFYSDIDNDESSERVRYFLAVVNAGSSSKNCFTAARGGSCEVAFNDFLTGVLKTAQVRVSTEGYYGTSARYAELFADGLKISELCRDDCSQCSGAWQGTRTFDVTQAAMDGSIQFLMDSTYSVRDLCDWLNPDHAMKALFEFSWTEEIANSGDQLKKGVIESVGTPATYPVSQEQVTIISSYVRNAPPIFSYYDKNGELITTDPAILRDTQMMKLLMVVNVNPNRPPDNYELEQYVQMRNLRQ
jgi:hypothetical protein